MEAPKLQAGELEPGKMRCRFQHPGSPGGARGARERPGSLEKYSVGVQAGTLRLWGAGAAGGVSKNAVSASGLGFVEKTPGGSASAAGCWAGPCIRRCGGVVQSGSRTCRASRLSSACVLRHAQASTCVSRGEWPCQSFQRCQQCAGLLPGGRDGRDPATGNMEHSGSWACCARFGEQRRHKAAAPARKLLSQTCSSRPPSSPIPPFLWAMVW